MKPSDPLAESNNQPQSIPKILVGICSCEKYPHKRQAVRETWMSRPVSGIDCQFFIGGTSKSSEEPDTLVLPVDDSYIMLPAKVIAFFAHALETSNFDWLFKCDDDTYLALNRLHELVPTMGEIVGNQSLADRGSPSGGAGYLLSRRVVTAIVADRTLQMEGDEDIIIGEAAVKHGAVPVVNNNLRWNATPYPHPDNRLVTAHWCSPERLRAIDARMMDQPVKTYEVRHHEWNDELRLYSNGTFHRSDSGCNGTWQFDDENGKTLHLNWFDWKSESVTACPGGFIGPKMALQDKSENLPRTLIFSSVGENQNAFATWLTGHAEVALVYHGDLPDEKFASILAKRSDYFATRKGGKFPNLLWLIDNNPSLLDYYDRFLIIDDDIALQSSDLEALIRTAVAWDLPVCSPAHDPEGKISWPHMSRDKLKHLEFCNFVEMTCVLFEREALRKFFNEFRPYSDRLVGWGADYIISSACFDNSRPFGVVHSVQVKNPHNRPGTGIDSLLAQPLRSAQWAEISKNFPIRSRDHVRVLNLHPTTSTSDTPTWTSEQNSSPAGKPKTHSVH